MIDCGDLNTSMEHKDDADWVMCCTMM